MIAGMVAGWPGPPMYGRAAPSLAALLYQLWPDIRAIHALGVIGSSLCAALWARAILEATGEARAARLTGLTLATMPWLVAVSRTEMFANLSGAFLGGAALGLLQPGPIAGLLGGTSVGLLACLRPELIPLAAVLWIALLVRRQWWGVAIAAVLLAVRGVEFVPTALDFLHAPATFPTGFGTWVESPARVLRQNLMGGVLMNPSVLPVALVPLAACGVVLGRGALRRAATACVALAISLSLLYLTQPHFTDQLRFQAASMPAWGAAAALGAAALWDLRRWAGMAAIAALAGSFVLASHPYGGRFLWQVEFEQLRAVAPAWPADATVYYDDEYSMSHIADYGALISRAHFQPRPAVVPPGAWVWIGAVDYRGEGPAPSLEGLEPIEVVQTPYRLGGLPGRGDPDGRLVPIGLFRQR